MCKAILEQGANKGKQCERPPLDNGYCGKHQKQAEIEKNIGNKKCPAKRCTNFLLPESQEKYCQKCLEKKDKEKKTIISCKMTDCTFKAQENGYCGKHQRQIYYNEEKEKGIKYCDIARGCFTVLENGKSSCDECLNKKSTSEKKLFHKRSELNKKMMENVNEKNTICVVCGKEYEKFKTMNGEFSKRCSVCNSYQKISSARH